MQPPLDASDDEREIALQEAKPTEAPGDPGVSSRPSVFEPIDFLACKEEMLRKQLRRRGIRDRAVLAAMGRVPRERFVPRELRAEAYADRALSIGCGQTISQPYMVALMAEALELCGRQRGLEIGTGSGYQAAILAELAAEVISVERHAPLSAAAQSVLASLGYRNATLVVGDGSQGWPDRAPYDRILVTAGAARCPPALVDQLAEGGILVIPLGTPERQVLQAVRKTTGQLKIIDLVSCRFVPLVGEGGWGE